MGIDDESDSVKVHVLRSKPNETIFPCTPRGQGRICADAARKEERSGTVCTGSDALSGGDDELAVIISAERVCSSVEGVTCSCSMEDAFENDGEEVFPSDAEDSSDLEGIVMGGRGSSTEMMDKSSPFHWSPH